MRGEVKEKTTSQIKEDFKRKSESYFELNYRANKNINRQYRQELVRNILRDLHIEGLDVLDAGSGPGVLGEIVKECKAVYFASDISIHNIEAAQKRLGDFPAVVADTRSLPFAAHSFDVVCSIGSIEYINDQRGALKEICRVTKADGVIIFTIASNRSPANWINDRFFYPFKSGKKKIKGQPLYRRYFNSLSRVQKWLAAERFSIERFEYITPGILDNQLKKISVLRNLERRLLRRFQILNKSNKEIVIVAKHEA